MARASSITAAHRSAVRTQPRPVQRCSHQQSCLHICLGTSSVDERRTATTSTMRGSDLRYPSCRIHLPRDRNCGRRRLAGPPAGHNLLLLLLLPVRAAHEAQGGRARGFQARGALWYLLRSTCSQLLTAFACFAPQPSPSRCRLHMPAARPRPVTCCFPRRTVFIRKRCQLY